MAQKLFPGNLGIASGLMVGFAIGTGVVGATVLGVLADHYGVPFALRSIIVLPVAALILSAASGIRRKSISCIPSRAVHKLPRKVNPRE